MNKKNISMLTLMALPFLITGCAAPAIIVAGGALATAPLRKKGVSGTINDNAINATISSKLYAHDPKIFTQIDVDVYMGEVLLTGFTNDISANTAIEKIIWKVDGVRSVYNHIQNAEASLLDYTHDSWITTKIKSQFLTDFKVKSLNYLIKTVAGTVYIMGIAETEKESQITHHIASDTSGVKKVISYVTLKGEES